MNPRHIAPFVIIAFAGSPALASQQCEGPLRRDVSDFVPIDDGSQVLDRKTGLVWMRCIEDQRWSGTTCIASNAEEVKPGPGLTHAQAVALAAARSTPDVRWRLPTRNELNSLREPGCYNPSLNLKVFPTEPAWSSDGFFWSSTPQATGFALVSAIGTSDAWADTAGSTAHHVRLVRNAPPAARK